MEEIGGKSEKSTQGCGKQHTVFEYCHQILENDVCGTFVCSLLKIWETAQIAYFIYIFFEMKERDGDLTEPSWGMFLSVTEIYRASAMTFIICMVIIWTCILIIPLGFLLQFLAFRFSYRFLHQTYRGIASMASVIIALLSSAFLIPSVVTLLTAFDCGTSLDLFSCWSTYHILVLIVNSLILVILLTTMVLSALLLYDDFFHSQYPYSGPPSYIRVIGIISKVTIAVGVVFDHSAQSITAWFAVVLAAHTLVIYMHLTQPPMWNQSFHSLIIFCEGFVVPYLLFFYVNNGFLDIYVTVLVLISVVLLSVALATAFVLVKTHLNINQVYTKSEQGRNADSWLLYLYRLMYLFQNQKDCEYERMQLVGLLSAYQDQCNDEECKCNTIEIAQPSKNTQRKVGTYHITEEKVLLQTSRKYSAEETLKPKTEQYAKVIHEILKSVLRQCPRSIDLKLFESYFLKGVLKNPYKSAYELAAAKNLRPNLLKSFAIYRYAKLIEADIKAEHLANKEASAMSVENGVEMERLYYLFKKQMEETATFTIEFLNCIKEEKLKGEKMETLASKIGLQNSKIASSFHRFVKSYPFHYRILIDYSKYLHLVLNCELEASQLFTNANDILKRIKEENAVGNSTIDLVDLSKNNKVAVLLISANAGKMGTILNCNSEVYDVFDHNPTRLLNYNISALLPPYFVTPHTHLIENYLEEYKVNKSKSKNNSLGLCMNAEGFLVPCKVQYKLYPNLEKGLKFVLFVQKVEKIVPLLPIKGFLKERDIGIMTCSHDGVLLGITKSIETNFGIPIAVVKGNLQKDSKLEQKLHVNEIIQGLSFGDYKASNGVQRVIVTNEKIQNYIDEDDPLLGEEEKKEVGEKYEAFAIVEKKVYPTLPLYQIVLVLNSAGKRAHKERVWKNKHDEVLVNAEATPKSEKKYSPIIKNIKESIKAHESSKVKLVSRVGFGLAVILFAMNTLVMMITLQSINISKGRVMLISNSWNRVVELANLHIYLTSLMSIAAGDEANSVHFLKDDGGRFENVRKLYGFSLENLRMLHNKINGKDTSFSPELKKFADDHKIKSFRLKMDGTLFTESMSFSIGISELITLAVEFVEYNQTDYLKSIRSPDYKSFYNKSLNLPERTYFYVLYNTLNYYRNKSVEFSETLQTASASAADGQFVNITILSSISLILVLLAGVVMIYIIINIKSTRLTVLAFYAQTPKKVLNEMAENTAAFLNEIDEFEAAAGSKRAVTIIKPVKEETKKQKMDESRIELLVPEDRKQDKSLAEINEADELQVIENEEEKKPYSAQTLNEIVKTKFVASIKAQRWYVACLICVFLVLFGLYIVFNIVLYWQSVTISNDSFSYMDTYLSLHSSLTFSMALYDNFVVSQAIQKTYDHPDTLQYYITKSKGKLLDSIKLKKKDESWLIGKVVQFQNLLDTPDGICDMYGDAGNNKELCKLDYNKILGIGMTSLMSRILDEMWTQYGKYLDNPSLFDHMNAKDRYIDLLRIKEEYINLGTRKLRELLKEELRYYFNILDVIAKSVYSVWVIGMVTFYFLYVRYLAKSLSKDIIRSNNILNMLPMEYLLTVVKDKTGLDLIKRIFLQQLHHLIYQQSLHRLKEMRNEQLPEIEKLTTMHKTTSSQFYSFSKTQRFPNPQKPQYVPYNPQDKLVVTNFMISLQ
eukprot:TRINITY_DN690_c0_g1_i1.p1 TRINITY_DN690_c0_g1~~TRINITY_DN690_c0_g1_i1.p1  ORF type:complete len:1663 (-),score=213.82 TRINITY_DN690_c0_g1_i1:1907-6895(-)